jgi:hypothetical protein
LVWGVNDFDESARLPWTHDLVRLATSVVCAIESQRLNLSIADACRAILLGYERSLRDGGRPLVLAEEHGWLRKLALSKLRSPVEFWGRLADIPAFSGEVPAAAHDALQQMLPARDMDVRIVHRVAGLGSLGRQRFVALAHWRGGWLAREAKALAPAATCWARGSTSKKKIECQALIDSAVRAHDPFVKIVGAWVVRRLAPDCTRIELGDLPRDRDEHRLLEAMGYETANVHLGTKSAQKHVLADLAKRPRRWLQNAARHMSQCVVNDLSEWRADRGASR